MRVFYQCGNGACAAAYKVLLLGGCPRCGSQMFEREGGMPKATLGGASNVDAGPGEVGYVAPAEEPVAGVSGAVTAPATPEPDEEQGPAAPKASDSKAAWAAYQVARGLDPAEADAMRKADLLAWEPPAPGELGAELTITAEAEVTHGEPEETGE